VSSARAVFTADDATLLTPGASKASRNDHPILEYQNGQVRSADFPGGMLIDYNPALVLYVRLFWAAQSAVAGDVLWSVAWERIDPNGQDLDADGFAPALTQATTTSATNGVTVETAIAFTQGQADGITPTDPYRLRVTRLGNAPADTMNNFAQLLRVEVDQG